MYTKSKHIVCSNSILTGQKADDEMYELVFNFSLVLCDRDSGTLSEVKLAK